MKICCLGDIHYGGSIEWLSYIVDNYIREYSRECDVAVIVGDVTTSGDLQHLVEALSIIKGALNIPLLVIPGNHDIYVSPQEQDRGNNSLLKLSLFNDLVEKLACVALMKRPYIVDGVGFVGSIGWYDYSFAPDYLGLTLEDFKAKAFGLSIWADRDYVKLPMSDEEFTLYLLNKFEEDIKRIYDEVNKMVAVMHHVPFRELVTYKLRPEWDYFSTYMGSESFGYIIKKYNSKVKLVLYGHSHDGVVTRICKYIDSIKCCNCASPIPIVIEI